MSRRIRSLPLFPFVVGFELHIAAPAKSRAETERSGNIAAKDGTPIAYHGSRRFAAQDGARGAPGAGSPLEKARPGRLRSVRKSNPLPV